LKQGLTWKVHEFYNLDAEEVLLNLEKALSELNLVLCGGKNKLLMKMDDFLNKGNANIEIKAGSGIREQMEVSNTTYNRFFYPYVWRFTELSTR
jgi:5'(3')-deoxyribonucleotidase